MQVQPYVGVKSREILISRKPRKQTKVFYKGQTAALFSIFSFSHVPQYAPFSLNLNALHFIPLSNTKRSCCVIDYAQK